MQDDQYIDTSGMDKSIMLYVGEKESADDDDDLDRRLKNRERQRRYRERKRREAKIKKASAVDQTTPLHNMQMPTELLTTPVQVDVLVNLTSPARVHCGRDWKKDARRAYVPNNSETMTLGRTPALISQSDFSTLDNKPSHRSISSKRHWKVEARNKKSLE